MGKIPSMLFSKWLDSAAAPTPAQVAVAAGVNLATVYKWRSGRVMPRPEQIQAIERITAGAVTASDLAAAAIAYQAKGPAVRHDGASAPEISMKSETAP